MRRDNFQLREHGAMMAQSAVFLDGDIQPEHQPSVEAKNSFEWSFRGVGLYVARSPEEQQDWARWIRKWSDGCNLMELSVTELMSASNILPPCNENEQVAMDMLNGYEILSRKNVPNMDIIGVACMMADARVDSEETDVLLVNWTEGKRSDKVKEIEQFELACEAGNTSAREARKRANEALKDDIEDDYTSLAVLSTRLRSYIQKKIDTIGDHESIIANLRAEGQQISPELADALVCEYHEHMLKFVDAGSLYRHLPPNTKMALVLDVGVFDNIMRNHGGYSTIQEAQDNGIGIHGFNSDNPVNDALNKMRELRDVAWEIDPSYELRKASLMYAKYQLPRAKYQDITPRSSEDF